MPPRASTDRPAPLIVHVFPTFAVGGAQMRFAAIANHFGPAFRHLVVSLDGDLSARDRLRPDLAISFPTIDAPKNAMLANAWRFRRLLRRWRPDVLVTGNWGAIEFALANRLFPLTRHIHVVDGFGPEERETQIPRRILVRRLALGGSDVVLPSRSLVRIATEVWKLDPRHVRYVPNGIDLGRFAAPAARKPNDLPVIGTVAGLRPEKNIARLLRAFALARVQHPARLLVVGDGPERPALQALAESLRIAESVCFAGQRSDTPALYAGMDVFALSSDTEQMPLSVIEAMASSLPVAATDVGDVRLMLAEPNTPYVTPLEEQALADALLALLRHPGQRVRLGAANRLKAEHEFDQAAMFAAWHDLYLGRSGAA